MMEKYPLYKLYYQYFKCWCDKYTRSQINFHFYSFSPLCVKIYCEYNSVRYKFGKVPEHFIQIKQYISISSSTDHLLIMDHKYLIQFKSALHKTLLLFLEMGGRTRFKFDAVNEDSKFKLYKTCRFVQLLNLWFRPRLRHTGGLGKGKEHSTPLLITLCLEEINLNFNLRRYMSINICIIRKKKHSGL